MNLWTECRRCSTSQDSLHPLAFLCTHAHMLSVSGVGALAQVAMLACARIGAVHSVVFGGFSSESLADRSQALLVLIVVKCRAGALFQHIGGVM